MRHSAIAKVRSCLSLILGVVLFLGVVPEAQAQSPLSWSASVDPDPVRIDGTARLDFAIDNVTGTPQSDVAFTVNLPAGLETGGILPSTTCVDGTISAPTGGSAIAFSGGKLGIS
ncbi:hypothetical protein [Aestuariicoccus sp. MJ-SS9]|uniref:DUF7933 domain-containing protein n=1 Tax=Aestuariicoccus sp. MJ-SS9 TaxID=3079855 RepID=UPI00291164F1|nr:hypothetical protein [Aestuariicoccus sp. MJ-SS9]MDU8910047.1 hypothetical protein [Aestuariicoccus sp. MJ-SS9]